MLTKLIIAMALIPPPGWVAEFTQDGTVVEWAATAEDDVWAVGSVLKHYDGDQWREIALPGSPKMLTGVSAVSSDDVWVSGYGDEYSYAAHWDGRDWTAYRPLNRTKGSRILDVAAFKGQAVFTGSTPNDYFTLITWDGKKFSVGMRVASLVSAKLTAHQPTGEYWGFDPTQPALIHGTRKDLTLSSMQGAPGSSRFADVWQVKAKDTWIVGQYGKGRALAMHWNGRSWKRSELPVVKARLDSVSSDPLGEAWISGVDPAKPKQVLFLRLHAGKWSASYGPELDSAITATATAYGRWVSATTKEGTTILRRP